MTQKTLEEQTAEVLAIADALKTAKGDVWHNLRGNLNTWAPSMTYLLRQWQGRCEKLLYAEDRMAKCYHTVDFENQELKKQNTALQQRVDRMREALEFYADGFEYKELSIAMLSFGIEPEVIVRSQLVSDQGRKAKQALAGDASNSDTR